MPAAHSAAKIGEAAAVLKPKTTTLLVEIDVKFIVLDAQSFDK